MARQITTLSIDDTSLRFMVSRGRRIVKLAELPLEDSLADIAAAGKEPEVAADIRNLLKSHKIGAGRVIVGLSGRHCLTRPLVLPELPRAMLAEAITREARRLLPVPLEQLYLSWQILNVSGGKTQVFIAAIPRQIADTVLKFLTLAGLKAHLMDVKPLALARLAPEASAIILDVQPEEFDIINIADGVPQPVRTVPFPGGSLSIDEKLAIVRDELERTIQFFNSHNAERPVAPGTSLLVSGEQAAVPERYAALAKELELKVAPLSSPLTGPDQPEDLYHLVNVGLALKELKGLSGPLLTNLNCLPAPYQPKQVPPGRIIALLAGAAAVALLVFLGMNVRDIAADIGLVKSQLDSTNIIIEKRQAERQELTEGIASMEQELEALASDRTVYEAALSDIYARGDLINGDMEAAVDNWVSGIDFYLIAHNYDDITISGQAPSEQEVLEYVRRLDATGRFAELTIDRLYLDDVCDALSEVMDFTLTLQLEEEE
jgi:type IV pilus assembly protein PilM